MRKYLVLLVTIMIALAGCKNDSEVYTELVADPIQSLDLAQNSTKTSHQLMADVYIGPNRINGDNEQINIGAESIEVSADGLVYTINLRDDIKWVDNTGAEQGNVTANDYVFAYRRMVDPNVGSVYSYIFENIENAEDIIAGEKDVEQLGVRAVDDYTLEIRLETVVPYFTNLLAFGSFVAQPQGAYELYGENYATSADTMWYSGPYYVSEYDPEYVVSITKNPLYFNNSQVEIERIDYRLNSDDASRLNAFLNGEANYAELDTVENYQIVKENGVDNNYPTMYSNYFVLSTDPASATSNPTLRQALSVGFDRDKVVEAVYGEINTPIEYIIPSGLTTATYDGLDYRQIAGQSLTSYDPDLANQLLDEYMQEMGYETRDQIELTYLLNSDSGDQSFAEVTQAFYKEQYGITIDIVATPNGDFRERSKNGAFDIMLTKWAPDYGDPSTYMALWKSVNIGSQNYAKYESLSYDQLYDDANAQTDPEQRFKMFAKCEQKLIDEGIIVPLYQKNQPYVIDSNYNFPEFVMFLISHEYLTTADN